MGVVNQSFDLSGGETAIIFVDRWGYPGFTVQVQTNNSIDIEGTLIQFNRNPEIDPDDDDNWEFLTGEWSGDASPVIFETIPDDDGLAFIRSGPLEAIRITANSGSATGRVMQTGAK